MRLVRLVIFIVIVVVGIVARTSLRNRNTSPGAPKSYDEMRQQFFEEATRSSSRRGKPPARPANLDKRLPAAALAEMRRLYPPTKDTAHAFDECYSKVAQSIYAEMDAIDANEEWYELLSPARRAVVLADQLDGEVNNGGFDQYFLNSSGDGAALAPAALRLLGQEKVAQMVERANAQFPGGPPADRNLRLIQMKILPEQARQVWSALDDEFYKLDLPPGGLSAGVAAAYILKHESEFFQSR